MKTYYFTKSHKKILIEPHYFTKTYKFINKIHYFIKMLNSLSKTDDL